MTLILRLFFSLGLPMRTTDGTKFSGAASGIWNSTSVVQLDTRCAHAHTRESRTDEKWLLLCDLINEVTELQETSDNEILMKWPVCKRGELFTYKTWARDESKKCELISVDVKHFSASTRISLFFCFWSFIRFDLNAPAHFFFRVLQNLIVILHNIIINSSNCDPKIAVFDFNGN